MSDYRALYRKWRSADFDDVYGQDAITDILKYEVTSGKLSHAYLFCGSRGTGKTTCAKILAKAVNCESPVNGNPCGVCEACRAIDSGATTDVLERDTVMYPQFVRERCIGCGRCHRSCMDGGHQAIRLDEDRRPVLNGQKCVGCHLCVLVCPQGAITSSRKRISRK